jgi:hypothetical protein
MKQLIAIILTTFAFSFTAYANEPTVTDSGVKLAKKKDHSKDKKVDNTKSPSKSTPAKNTKAPAKTEDKSAK